MSTDSSEEWDDPPLEGRILATKFEHTAIDPVKFRTYTKCDMEPEPVWTEDQLLKLPSGFHDKVRNRKACASFGENGTTASVNSYGRIMQISRYFGYGRSGFFCADQSDLSEPWLVQRRMEQLMDRSKDHENGIRLDFGGLVDTGGLQPSLEFAFDRWPRFVFHQNPTHESYGTPNERNLAQQPPSSASGQTPLCPPELIIQYFCHEGSVFQRHLYRRYRYKISEKELNNLRIDAEVSIRNLDFEQYNSTFNKNTEAQRPCFRRGPKDRSLIIVHEITRETADQIGIDLSENGNSSNPTAAALIITPFADGMAQKVTERGYISLHKRVKRKFIDEGNIDITLGYRLQLLEQDPKWENSLVPAAHFGRMGDAFSLNEPFQRIRFSEHEQFNFLVRRNLEHVLSVCCIPIPKSPILGSSEENFSAAHPSASESEPLPVAITCGDMSGHFIGARASLSIFQFLCSMLKFLNPEHDCSDRHEDNSGERKRGKSVKGSKACQICADLYERIRTMLQGHVQWICAAEPSEGGTFSPHYWATGKPIEDWYWLPPRSLVDTPIQLLKISWMDHFGLEETQEGKRKSQIDIPRWMLPCLKEKIASWISSLNESSPRGNYAFLEDSNKSWWDEQRKFRLVDHVMICLALKWVGAQEWEEEFAGGPGTHSLEKSHYRRIRAKILKRFTTEGPLSKQQMLATSRTPTRSRFLFHSKDTFLFLAMNMGFFRDGDEAQTEKRRKKKSILRDIDSRWKNTIDVQAYHDEYQHFKWEKPLWYALAFIMGCQGRQTNKSSVENILKVTSNTILDQCFPDGLLPGFLNRFREPIPFEDETDRDDYWHATFETLHVLWTSGKEYFNAYSDGEKAQMCSTDSYIEKLSGKTATSRDDTRIGQIATKTFPFVCTDSLIDQERIVNIPDDWLLSGPGVPKSVFGSTEETEGTQSSTGSINGGTKHTNPMSSAAIEAANLTQNHASPDWGVPKGTVIDIPQKRFAVQSRQRGQEWNTLMHCLRAPRTMQLAKKRLIYLPNVDEEAKKLCFDASPVDEKYDTKSFFDRHTSRHEGFIDAASGALNYWETELHLSYFRLSPPGEYERDISRERCQSEISRSSFVEIAAASNGDSLRKETVSLSRETMSFRFVGDFYDRFWTCYYLNNPQEKRHTFKATHSDRALTYLLKRLTSVRNNYSDRDIKHPLKQRKVLELNLFHVMLSEIHSSTEEILEWVEDRIFQRPVLKRDSPSVDGEVENISQSQPAVKASVPFNSVAKAVHREQLLRVANSENYSVISDNWRTFEQILQAIEDNLDENIRTIDQWTRREDDRGLEKPRWTRNDERLYGQEITQAVRSNQLTIRDIVRLKAKIKASRESLRSRLESVRDDISFRGSENINLFTYVTVIFLPLGFATGIFSMSAPPDHSTLVSMIELALIALALTIFALANAKTTGTIISRPIIQMLRGMNTTILRPVILLTIQPILLVTVSLWNKMIFLLCWHVGFPVSRPFTAQNKGVFEKIQKITNISERLDAALKENPIAKAREKYDSEKRDHGTEMTRARTRVNDEENGSTMQPETRR